MAHQHRTASEQEVAHDVLAAEEFAVPAPDALRHHGPVVLPEDPSGIPEAHDVLAAEEFAMPAVHEAPFGAVLGRRSAAAGRLGQWAAIGLLAYLVLRTLRHR